MSEAYIYYIINQCMAGAFDPNSLKPSQKVHGDVGQLYNNEHMVVAHNNSKVTSLMNYS